MNKVIYILCFFAFISCTERQDYKKKLMQSQIIMEASPDSSLVILDSLGKYSKNFDKGLRMQYELTLTYAKAKTGVRFQNDSLTGELVKYFDRKGNRTEKALAYYLQGCALSDIGQSPEALQSFYDAIDKVDTTSHDIPYNILKGIYGQMSIIFHEQNLPQDEIWALKHYIECVRKTSSEKDFIIAKGQMIRPYYLLGEKDTVLKIINDTYKSLKELGLNRNAVSSFGTAIHIYTDCGQMKEATKAVNAFEHESGLFDKYGNIARGREGYYFTKGNYEFALGNIESAEKYYRRAIQYGHLSEGYKGLVNVYRTKGNMDSVAFFSEMFEKSQDSLHNKMRTESIHRMSALYNYTRSQKEAETEREKSRTATIFTIAIIIAAVIIIGLITWFYKRAVRNRREKIIGLKNDLDKALNSRDEIHQELQQLKSHDYDGVIASKERKLDELTKAIERLQSENKLYKENSIGRVSNNLEQFLKSDIASLFIKKATDKETKVQPTEAEWKNLISEFGKDNPAMFKSFASDKTLSKLEQRVCILLILDIPENIISLMTNSSASTVSNSKARANEKLFGKRDAHPLKINLIHALKAI